MARWTTWLIGAWTFVILATGLGAALDASETTTDSLGVGEVRPSPATPPEAMQMSLVSAPSPPSAVVAPAVGIKAPLVPVSKTPDGALAVPDFGTAGWYQHSPPPGAIGSAVLAGHIDSLTGPDVFFGLAQLRPGDEIVVQHADGSASIFTVYNLETTDKDALPVDRIFDHPDRPELRLVTCGGEFDRRARSYTSNVIVYAHLVGRK